MEQQLISTFRKNGIKIGHDETSDDLAGKLGSADVNTLQKIVGELYDGDTVPEVEGDEFVKSLTYSYALLDAFEFETNSIEQEDIETAHNKAVDAVAKMSSENEDEDEEVEASAEEETEEVEASSEETEEAPKLTKKKIIEDLIDENPDAKGHEIVEMATEQYPDDIKESTARMYFYTIRKERGLAPNGKRGRRPNDTSLRVRSIVADNMDKPKADVVQKIMELGLTESTASQYYSTAKTALKEES